MTTTEQCYFDKFANEHKRNDIDGCSEAMSYCYNCGLTFCRRHRKEHLCFDCVECGEPMIKEIKDYALKISKSYCLNKHELLRKIKPYWHKDDPAMSFVRMAKELLLMYSDKECILDKLVVNLGEVVILKDVCVSGDTTTNKLVINKHGEKEYLDKGALFVHWEELIKIHHSFYKLKYSLPKSQVKKFKTQELNMPQNIEITKWAYEVCHEKAVNYILENWAKQMYGLLQTERRAPMYLHSPYKTMIMELRVNNEIEQNKRNKKNDKYQDNELVSDKPNEKNDLPITTDNKEQAKQIFYCIGKGDIHNGRKIHNKGYYVVLLESKNIKWHKQCENITHDQALMKAILGVFIISKRDNYDNIEIRIDNSNPIKYILNMDDFITNIKKVQWNTDDVVLLELLSAIEQVKDNVKTFSIMKIDKKMNKAYSVGIPI